MQLYSALIHIGLHQSTHQHMVSITHPLVAMIPQVDMGDDQW